MISFCNFIKRLSSSSSSRGCNFDRILMWVSWQAPRTYLAAEIIWIKHLCVRQQQQKKSWNPFHIKYLDFFVIFCCFSCLLFFFHSNGFPACYFVQELYFVLNNAACEMWWRHQAKGTTRSPPSILYFEPILELSESRKSMTETGGPKDALASRRTTAAVNLKMSNHDDNSTKANYALLVTYIKGVAACCSRKSDYACQLVHFSCCLLANSIRDSGPRHAAYDKRRHDDDDGQAGNQWGGGDKAKLAE